MTLLRSSDKYLLFISGLISIFFVEIIVSNVNGEMLQPVGFYNQSAILIHLGSKFHKF